MEIKRLGTTKLTVKFNTKYTAWNDTQTDFIGIEGEARSRCYSFKIQDAEGINFISENVKMLFKERGSSKVYFSKAVWSQEEEVYYCDIPGNILQKTQIIDIQVCVEDGTTRILTPVITKQVLSSLMSGAAANSGNDIYIDFENLNDIQKIIDSEEERKENELERIEDSKRIKDMLDTNLDSELKKYSKIEHNHYGQLVHENTIAKNQGLYGIFAIITIARPYASQPLVFDILARRDLPNSVTVLCPNTYNTTASTLKIYTSGSTDVWAYKKNESTWELIARVGYGDPNCPFSVCNVQGIYYNNGINVEFPKNQAYTKIPEGAIKAIPTKQYATKTELISNINLLNAKIDAKNKNCVTKAEYAKDKKRLNSTIAREKKLETLAGLILEELRKQNPDLKPVNISNILKIEEDEE